MEAMRQRQSWETRFPYAAIPLGTRIRHIELAPGRGGQIARASDGPTGDVE